VLAEVEARESGAAADSSGGEQLQMCNPPFAHSVSASLAHCIAIQSCVGMPWDVVLKMAFVPMAQVATGEKDAAGGARLAAVACGDGSVALLLLDAPATPRARTAWSLSRGAGGHSACASHAAFPAFAAGAPLLLSAGNDGRALLWDWGAYVAGTQAAPRVAAEAQHGAKVNWTASGAAPAPRLYLADTSRHLAVYDVRLG
jgi:hypothetical protein